MRGAAGTARRVAGRLFLLAAISLAAGPELAAQSVDPDKNATGWVNDVRGMRHFSGLRCPDEVAAMTRTKILPSDSRRQAGCIYSARSGLTAVLRRHLKGSGGREAQNFLERYKAAGYQRLTLTGPAASGLSFKTYQGPASTKCETLWHFSGKNADFTLWMQYQLPAMESEIGITLDGFRRALSLQN